MCMTIFTFHSCQWSDCLLCCIWFPNRTLIFHAINEISGFLLYMHQQIPLQVVHSSLNPLINNTFPIIQAFWAKSSNLITSYTLHVAGDQYEYWFALCWKQGLGMRFFLESVLCDAQELALVENYGVRESKLPRWGEAKQDFLISHSHLSWLAA